MNLVLLCHPDFMASKSMPRFARMLGTQFEARGHRVRVWSPAPRLYRPLAGTRLAKWGGYVDQYLVFPAWVRRRLGSQPADTLFVFCDQALGPWVPLVKDRPHVVHVHDLLALRSALGEFPQNPTSWTGRLYQRYIRRGFRQARHFICISKKSRDDLQAAGGVSGATCEVVYNGLNFAYAPLGEAEARKALSAAGLPPAPRDMLLHVGAGQWYKNQAGLIALYARYAESVADPLPLWCVSPPPGPRLAAALAAVPARGEMHFLQNLADHTLQAAYSLARAFLYPSIAEGFGWPLVEAQACGCPVITTDAPPMNEVAGPAATYLPVLSSETELDAWARRGAAVLRQVLDEDPAGRERRVAAGRAWAARFAAHDAIEGYLAVYQRVLEAETRAALPRRDAGIREQYP